MHGLNGRTKTPGRKSDTWGTHEPATRPFEEPNDFPQGLKPNERELLMSELKLQPLKSSYETGSRK
jgi:hypothetical protein